MVWHNKKEKKTVWVKAKTRMRESRENKAWKCSMFPSWEPDVANVCESDVHCKCIWCLV